MKSVVRRISRLEDRLAPIARPTDCRLTIRRRPETRVGRPHVYTPPRDAGHIAPGSAISLADFTHIPDGLDATELEKHLREHGVSPMQMLKAETCVQRKTIDHGRTLPDRSTIARRSPFWSTNNPMQRASVNLPDPDGPTKLECDLAPTEGHVLNRGS